MDRSNASSNLDRSTHSNSEDGEDAECYECYRNPYLSSCTSATRFLLVDEVDFSFAVALALQLVALKHKKERSSEEVNEALEEQQDEPPPAQQDGSQQDGSQQDESKQDETQQEGCEQEGCEQDNSSHIRLVACCPGTEEEVCAAYPTAKAHLLALRAMGLVDVRFQVDAAKLSLTGGYFDRILLMFPQAEPTTPEELKEMNNPFLSGFLSGARAHLRDLSSQILVVLNSGEFERWGLVSVSKKVGLRFNGKNGQSFNMDWFPSTNYDYRSFKHSTRGASGTERQGRRNERQAGIRPKNPRLYRFTERTAHVATQTDTAETAQLDETEEASSQS